MPVRPPLPFLTTSSQARSATLQGLLIATIVIGGLYFGREVLLPLVIAILLTFVLTPPVRLLRRFKVPRALAVGIVVATAFAIIGGLGWIVSQEATKIVSELPNYRLTLSQKIQSLRESAGESKVLEKAGDVLSDLKRELEEPAPDAEPDEPEVGELAERPEKEPIPVEIREPELTGFDLYRSIAGTVLPPLVTAGIVLLFTIFILLQREDLRDRLIRLFGASDLQRATSTMNDAATRLSRYFLSQVLINSAYGLFIGLSLWGIGMASPIAWGILAMLMRFVPYVGSYIAAGLPVLVAAAIDPGWSTVLMVLGLFIVSELVMGQVVEPYVFGRGTGVTPIAVIASTIFWTWLWGPLGLIIAMPITLCLAVLGRHVEGLGFLEVLLSDQPALTPEQGFYQRTLTGDAAEITYEAEVASKDQSLESYLGTVALGGLKLAEHDAARGALDEERAARIGKTVNEMLINLADFEPRRWVSRPRNKDDKEDREDNGGLAALDEAEEDAADQIVDRASLAPGWAVETPVLCIGGRSALDEAAGAILAEILTKRGLEAKVLSHEALSAGHITSLSDTEAKLICLSYLGLDSGPAQIRYIVRRLRRILPEEICILVACWSAGEDRFDAANLLETTGADAYAGTLQEAVEACIKAAQGDQERAPPVQPVAKTKRKGKTPTQAA